MAYRGEQSVENSLVNSKIGVGISLLPFTKGGKLIPSIVGRGMNFYPPRSH